MLAARFGRGGERTFYVPYLHSVPHSNRLNESVLARSGQPIQPIQPSRTQPTDAHALVERPIPRIRKRFGSLACTRAGRLVYTDGVERHDEGLDEGARASKRAGVGARFEGAGVGLAGFEGERPSPRALGRKIRVHTFFACTRRAIRVRCVHGSSLQVR